jgi:peptide methionine sulfoxide reductase MsrB
MGQVYTNDKNFTKFIPMKKKSDVSQTLVQFMQATGIPSHLHTVDAKEITQGKWESLQESVGLRCHRESHTHLGKCVQNFVTENSRKLCIMPWIGQKHLIDFWITVPYTMQRYRILQHIH